MAENELKQKYLDAVHEKMFVLLDNVTNQLSEMKEQTNKSLEEIKAQTTKTNGRVTKAESEIISIQKDLSKALVEVSKHSGLLVAFKEEKDHKNDLLIKTLQKQLESKEEKEKDTFKRIIYGIIVVLGFLLVTAEFINPELFKLLLRV